jgi:predicted nicotinamide N-methyase
MEGSLPHGRARPGALKDDAPRLTPTNAEAFIRANTALAAAPNVPEIWLHLADEAHELWLKTEDELAEIGLPPPFWAFAWAGGQGLARHVLDHPEIVCGLDVLDFASGSGLVGIAAVKAGAIAVVAADIDPFSATAVAMNAAANGVAISHTSANLIQADHGWDVVLAGDVFYDRALAAELTPWLHTLTRRGATVLIGDPGRSYLPKQRLEPVAVYQVAVTRLLEDAEVKRTTVWRFA